MVATRRTRPPEFMRRVHNRPALRRKSSVAVFLQLTLVSSGLAIGGGIGYLVNDYLVTHQTFRLAHLQLDEIPEPLRERVREQLDPAIGVDLLAVDLGELRRRVELIPEVREASVRRLLPDSVAVAVTPHSARARLRTDDGDFRVTRNGIVLGVAETARGSLPLMLLEGELLPALDETLRLPASLPGTDAYTDAVRIADWLSGVGADQFGAVEYLRLDPRGVILIPRGGAAAVLLGGASNLAEKAERYRAVQARETPDPMTLVDLRYRDMVVVRELPPVAAGRQE